MPAMILFRFIEATLGVANGTRSALIVSHEAEEEVERVSRGEYEE